MRCRDTVLFYSFLLSSAEYGGEYTGRCLKDADFFTYISQAIPNKLNALMGKNKIIFVSFLTTISEISCGILLRTAINVFIYQSSSYLVLLAELYIINPVSGLYSQLMQW